MNDLRWARCDTAPLHAALRAVMDWVLGILLMALATAPATAARPSLSPGGRPQGDEIGQAMNRGGCMLCHRWDRSWIGPSFREIAQRYQGAGLQERQMLMARLRSGEVGNHGPVPMSACDASQVSDEDLRLIIDHILDQGGSRRDAPAR